MDGFLPRLSLKTARVLLYGVRLHEMKFPQIPQWKPTVRLLNYRKSDPAYRPPVAESLGCHVVGAVPFKVDPSDAETTAAGVLKRSATLTPSPDPQLLEELFRFMEWFVPTQFSPLAANTDVTFETWLASCKNYSQARKNELIRIHHEIRNRKSRRNFSVKSFVKDEWYDDIKHSRIINSRADAFKCMVGPKFRAIENVFFKHKDFIKKIPVADRPAYIRRRLHRRGCKVQCADFTAMEAHFHGRVFEIEFWFYHYMLQFVEGVEEFDEWMNTVLNGENQCFLKNFLVKVFGSRMSGEMNTSLGNGFVNWILSKFFAYRNGCLEQHDGLFEGDDSIVVTPFPPTVEDYRRIGFTVKIFEVDSIEEASFCGLIFDADDQVNVTDPIMELLTFGWTNKRYVGAKMATKLSLLRCKSLSMMYQYQGCPVLAALARYGLRVSRGYCIDKVRYQLSQWEQDQLTEATDQYKRDRFASISNRQIGDGTRLLVEKKFGLRYEHQIEIEKTLDAMTTLTPIDIPFLTMYVPDLYRRVYRDYVVEASQLSDPFYPAVRQPEVHDPWTLTGRHPDIEV